MRSRENCFKENDYGRSEVSQPISKSPKPTPGKENTFGRISDFKYGMDNSTALTFKGKEDNVSFKASNHDYGAPKPVLNENKNTSNITGTDRPSTGGYKPGVPIPEPKSSLSKPKKNRCSWNKFTYGAGPSDLKSGQKNGSGRPSIPGHDYGAGSRPTGSNTGFTNRDRSKSRADLRSSFKAGERPSYNMESKINSASTPRMETTPNRFRDSKALKPLRERETHNYGRESLNKSITKLRESKNTDVGSKFSFKRESEIPRTSGASSTKQPEPSIEELMKRPKEKLTALERSKVRMAQMKKQPKPNQKNDEDIYKRDTNFIRRRQTDNAYGAPSGPSNSGGYTPMSYGNRPSYTPTTGRHGYGASDENRGGEYMYDLVKKYNPGIRKENIQSHLNKASEVSGMFRKGGRRRHNYGYIGQIHSTNRSKERMREEEITQRLNFIKRDENDTGHSFTRRYERALPSTTNNFRPGERSYTPTPGAGTARNYSGAGGAEPKPYVSRFERKPTEAGEFKRDISTNRLDRKTTDYVPGSYTNREYTARSKSPISKPIDRESKFTRPSEFDKSPLQKTRTFGRDIPSSSLDRTFKRYTPKTEFDLEKARENRSKPSESFAERYNKFQAEHGKKFTAEKVNDDNAGSRTERYTPKGAGSTSGSQKVRKSIHLSID